MSSASFQHGGYPGLLPVPDPNVEEELEIEYTQYQGEAQLPEIVRLIEKELSEPYIIYTYRYFLQQWPQLCMLAYARRRRRRESEESKAKDPASSSETFAPVGVIVSKVDRHSKGERLMRGYIAMLSVHTAWRGCGIAKQLAQRSVERMTQMGAQEIVLETEVDNQAALSLYESLRFMREKRLFRFYLNGKDAFRLVYAVPAKDEAWPNDGHSDPTGESLNAWHMSVGFDDEIS
ncbi:acyl-CoA N-acyltransferase [Tilletiaria anomala UBC 951]|uniref:Acyl-CoA N-acyltransferase n=1 Tax=Tilletiaria anomala (strain ATCC 24038 / CBS 436.72 / UBC 951) TaxID=1037660 RepID=A0A066VVP1_TILAU|nr:acyl-CoA N-acyltransferase [Tilletiaria anomala UBC 951]KDN42844.1 acyl-CoA N-acyltransferase [Tilletiaria anomala UBC 951]